MAETTGQVQRIKWVGALNTIFVYIGPLPNAVRLLLIRFSGTNRIDLAARGAMAHNLVEAYTHQFPVTVRFDTSDSIIDQIDTRFTSVRVDALEITQSVQNLTHSVSLVALKRTVARAYVSYALTPGRNVQATLQIRRSGSPTITVESDNSIAVDQVEFGQLEMKRDDESKSLNFILPPAATSAGPVEISLVRVTDSDTGEVLDPNLIRSTVSVSFVPSPPLRLRIVGLSYQTGTPAVNFVPTALDFALVSSWLQRAYPVAMVVGSQTTVASNNPPPFTCGQANAQIAAIRALDVAAGVDNRTHYYGLVSDGGFFMRGCAGVPSTPNPAAIGSGPTGANTWGWDGDGSYGDWYAGHELGHTFGRKHPGFCGESNDDDDYPFANGQIGDDTNTFAGFDVGDPGNGVPMQALPKDVWKDVMTYCSNQWLSSYTYEGIRARLIEEDALGAGAGAGAGRPDERTAEKKAKSARPPRLVNVVANVNLTQGSGEIAYVDVLERGEVSPAISSPVALAAFDAQDNDIQTQSVEFIESSDMPDEQVQGIVSAIIAVHPDAVGLRLYVNERQAAQFVAGPTPKAVRNIQNVEARNQECVTVRWDGIETVLDGRHFNVQISTDNGRSWETVAVGIKQPNADIFRHLLKGAREALVRVTQSNGFEAETTTKRVSFADSES